jgi:hypothetical protein
MEFSLTGNQKVIEGTAHPDRNEQFRFINERTKEFQIRGQPVISVDSKCPFPSRQIVFGFVFSHDYLIPENAPRSFSTRGSIFLLL